MEHVPQVVYKIQPWPNKPQPSKVQIQTAQRLWSKYPALLLYSLSHLRSGAEILTSYLLLSTQCSRFLCPASTQLSPYYVGSTEPCGRRHSGATAGPHLAELFHLAIRRAPSSVRSPNCNAPLLDKLHLLTKIAAQVLSWKMSHAVIHSTLWWIIELVYIRYWRQWM